MRLRGILASSIVSLSLAAFFGCSSSNGSSPPPSGPTIPGVGSTFTVLDSMSVAIMVSTGVYTVTAVNGNIMTVLNPPGVGNDTTRHWYRFESNGDVSMDPKPSGSHGDFFILPFASQNQVNATDPFGFDTTYTTAIGEGSGSFTVNGQPYSTQKVKVTQTNSGASGPSTMVSHWAYAPSIGYIVSIDEEETTIQGTPQPADHRKLISFVKK